MTTKPAVKARLIATIGAIDLHETTDGQRSLLVTPAGSKVVSGSAWGPAADGTGEWFASRRPASVVRVPDRQTAIDYITTAEVAPSAARRENRATP